MIPSNIINDEFKDSPSLKPLSIRKVRAFPSDRTDRDDIINEMTNPPISREYDRAYFQSRLRLDG